MDAKKLAAAIDLFRTLDPEMQAQAILTFLMVADKPKGVKLEEIKERLGVALSSASRNVYKLSRVKFGTKPGLDLVASEENPYNRREKIIELTTKGKQFAKAIALL